MRLNSAAAKPGFSAILRSAAARDVRLALVGAPKNSLMANARSVAENATPVLAMSALKVAAASAQGCRIDYVHAGKGLKPGRGLNDLVDFPFCSSFQRHPHRKAGPDAKRKCLVLRWWTTTFWLPPSCRQLYPNWQLLCEQFSVSVNTDVRYQGHRLFLGLFPSELVLISCG